MLDFTRNRSGSIETMLIVPSFLHSLGSSTSLKKHDFDALVRSHDNSMEDIVEEVRRLFEAPLEAHNLLQLSRQMQGQFKERLRSDTHCMLPSYNHTLPHGNERGTYLALDVGGSTLRVALVELYGRSSADGPMRIMRMETSCIDDSVKALKGLTFFDWLAARVEHMLLKGGGHGYSTTPLPMGLSWSFPIAQTSSRNGTLLGMGKGFACSSGVLGQDLGEVITQACQRRNLKIRMEAIVNDSSATLLSSAYLDDSIRIALIFGTGMNAAVHLPVTALGVGKLTSRPKSWHDRAHYVLVNTELGMFGKGILPTTRWDDELNSCHLSPDYQPFEYLITGRYLGEIVRLMLVEMAATNGVLGGDLPASLLRPYSLDTHTIAIVEADDTPTLANACTFLQDHHSFPTLPTLEDLQYIQMICRYVSRRATAYLATGIHALWKLRTDTEGLDPHGSGPVSIGCNGSVINKYPGFFHRCQEYVDVLTEAEGLGRGRVVLEPAHESAILGAAVAVALAEKEEP